MSSPSATTSDRKKPVEQITFRFCSECSNMLYPKEDEVERKLMFTCRTCNFSEEATSSCIFRNTMNNAVGETAGVTQDVGSDPTVGSSSFCSDTDPFEHRRTDSFPINASSTSPSTASACVSSCLGCGRMFVCGACGDHFKMLHADLGMLEPEIEGSRGLEFDRDLDTDDELDVDPQDVEVVAWTGESLDELGALLSRTEDFFGLRNVELSTEENATSALRPGVPVS